jgi:hypothetical protein
MIVCVCPSWSKVALFYLGCVFKRAKGILELFKLMRKKIPEKKFPAFKGTGDETIYDKEG